MKFMEDLIKEFVSINGARITDFQSYLSGVGNQVVNVYTNAGEKYTFVGFEKCTRYLYGQKARNNDGVMKEWQKFVIKNTQGFQRDSLIDLFREVNKKELNNICEYLINWNYINGDRRDSSIENYAEVKVRTALQLEELKCLVDRESTRFKRDFEIIAEGLMTIRALYNSAFQEKIDEFYKYQEFKSQYNEEGQQILIPNEQQTAIINRLNNIKERFDEMFKEQIYLADQKELEVFGEQS